MRAWYLIYTKPQQEKVALDNLERQHYRAYLPMVRVRRRVRGRRRLLLEPLFPRYLFVRLSDVNEDWGPVRSTKGVSRMVRFGAKPAVVPSNLIAFFKDNEDESGVQDLPEPSYAKGDRVVISDGPMAGYEAIFAAITGKERVLVLLDIAGIEAKVQMDIEQIEPVSSG